VPAKLLASLAGKAQFLYLAIPAAHFFLREVHNVISTKTNWSAHVNNNNNKHAYAGIHVIVLHI
jgi:hypothetical protein